MIIKEYDHVVDGVNYGKDPLEDFYKESFLSGLPKNAAMFYTYIIKSINHDFIYKGHCEDPEERLKQHNSGMTESIMVKKTQYGFKIREHIHLKNTRYYLKAHRMFHISK